jgi:hypothetical protein
MNQEPAATDHPATSPFETEWVGEWRSSDDGHSETRPSVGKAGNLYYAGLEVSYGGDECQPDFAPRGLATLDEAIAKSLSMEARYHRDRYHDSIRGEATQSLYRDPQQSAGRGRST